MTPEFERAINEAVARLCAWTKTEVFATRYNHWQPPGKAYWTNLPSFATDRNALPEVIVAVESQGEDAVNMFTHWLYDGFLVRLPVQILKCPNHFVCIAALKACNAWTDDLQALWQKEQGK